MINRPSLKPQDVAFRASEIEAMLKEGRTQGYMARELHLTRGAISAHLIRHGLIDRYHAVQAAKKAEPTQRKQSLYAPRTELATLLAQRGYQLTKDDWPLSKALEYRLNRHPCRETTFGTAEVLPIFQVYRQALINGEPLSLEEISKRTGIFYVRVRDVLVDVDVEPMYGRRTRLTNEQLQERRALLKRMEYSEFSLPDIAYFSGYSMGNLQADAYKLGLHRGPRSNLITMVNEAGKQEALTYRLISELYYFHDSGFTMPEVIELFELNPNLINYAFDHRHQEQFEPTIIRNLKLLDPNRTFQGPYKYLLK